MIIGIITWLIFSILIGILGSNRKIGFAGAFFLSLLLSPIIGLIFTLTSKSLSAEEYEKKLLETQKKQQVTIERLFKQNESNATEELLKIKELLDKGIIDEKEFKKMKEITMKKIDDAIEYENKAQINKEDNSECIIEDSYDKLNDKEKQIVNTLLKSIEYGHVISKHSVNNEISIMSKTAYEKWINYYGTNFMILLAEK